MHPMQQDRRTQEQGSRADLLISSPPTEEPLKGKTLVYMLAFPSRPAAIKDWAAFKSDPEWRQVAAASEANGKIVEKVDSIFLEPTDFSMIN